MNELISQTGTITVTPELRQRAIECVCVKLLVDANQYGRDGTYLQQEYQRHKLPESTTSAVLEIAGQMMVWLAKELSANRIIPTEGKEIHHEPQTT